jgi:hypothetical protein
MSRNKHMLKRLLPVWMLLPLVLMVVLYFFTPVVTEAGGGGNNNSDNDSGISHRDTYTRNIGATRVTTRVTGYNDGSYNATTNVFDSNGDLVARDFSSVNQTTGEITHTTRNYHRGDGDNDNNDSSYQPPADSCAAQRAKYQQCIGSHDRMGEAYRSCGRTAPTCTTQTASSCNTADLDVEGIARIDPSGRSVGTDLEANTPYDLRFTVRNRGCADTQAAGRRESPFARSEGNFPIRLRIDLNHSGPNDNTRSIDETYYLNDQQAIREDNRRRYMFEDITFPPGTHRLYVTIDPPGHSGGDSGNGCSRPEGCIVESGSAGNNESTVLINVSEPSITLGSFLIDDDTRYQATARRVSDFSSASSRDIAGLPNEVGLYWEGEQVRMNTCVGSGPGFAGVTNAAGDTSYWAYVSGYPSNDATIDEPAPGDTHTFRITCDTTSGGTVTDTFRLTDGGTVPPDPDPDPDPPPGTPPGTPPTTPPVTPPTPTDVTLLPSVNSITIDYGDTIDAITFSVSNTEPADADNSTIEIFIDGNRVDTSNLNIPGDDSVTHTEPFTPDFEPLVDNTRYDLRVCADHPNNTLTGDARCADAFINVRPGTQCFNGRNDDPAEDSDTDDADRGCWTDPTDPSTYDQADDDERDPLEDPEIMTGNGGSDPTVVRQGDEITIEWNPNEDPNDDSRRDCTLSANIPFSPNTNVPAGSTTFTAERTAEYRIDCSDGPFDTVTVQVIPIIFET